MEEFKDIPGYEGLYQVSNLGRVRSLPRKMVKGKSVFISTEKILKSTINSRGYMKVLLYKSDLKICINVHQLVAMAFLNHVPNGNKLVIDHINDDRTDNRLDNLQVVTQRFNICKTQGKYSSKYKGVSFNKLSNKWVSSIYINGKSNHLGVFNCELAASLAYQNKIKS